MSSLPLQFLLLTLARVDDRRPAAATRSISNAQPLTAASTIAPNGKNTFLVLKTENDRPNLWPSWFRPDYESPSLVFGRHQGQRAPAVARVALERHRHVLARSELAAVYDDGDGNLKLALYMLNGAGTPKVSVRRDSVRFPLPEQPFDISARARVDADVVGRAARELLQDAIAARGLAA